MNQQQIQQLFQLRYNQNNWKQFLSQSFSDARFLATPDVLTGINTDVATQVLRLGYVNLNENGIERNIAVYDVTLAPGIVLERNRVGLRNLLRKYWKDIDAAFIVYHRPENPNWRFTYVSELTGFDAEGELIKVKTEPKRYTYILGEGESCRTAAERFAIVAKKGNKTSLDDVKDAFSVEKLSKSFFDEYKKHYELFCNYMVSKPNIRQTIFNGDEKAIRDFNKKLLGRIVFLYFIQKKGWLGVPENSAWGQGDPDFLWNLFNNARNKGLFYSEYLTRLFFDTLNTPRPNDIIELKKGEPIKIPFLNGGLFEEDNKNYRNLIFPADLFENLFLFFNQYNFTIYEDDPNDHTVAVDPEMLGHIFENLLEDNKDKGAYYTPKEIVHYMCQESLIEYLCTTLQIEDEAKEKEAVTALLKQKEMADILKPEIENINDALDKVKICDPAIGSGAFPMGLLKEIFTAKQTLYTFENGNTEGFDASGIKLNIIQNSIYGVDIEKGAVDIARLRFWLSLVVDEEAPKALPNLDYKIVVGNSLVSKLGDDIIDIDWNLNETSHGLFGAELALQKAELLKKISKEQKEFFNPISDKKKLAADIRKLKIDLLINQLELMVKTEGIETLPNGNGKAITKQTERYLETLGWKQQIEKLKKLKAKPEEPLQFFDWKLDFPEVLNPNLTNNKDGFDIVIGNPPYIGQKGNKKLFEPFKKSTKWKNFYERKQDIYYYFIAQGIELISPFGTLSYINPPYFLTAEGGKNLRKFIAKNSNITKILNLSESYNVFENVSINSLILFLDKKPANESKRIEIFYPDLSDGKNNLQNLALIQSKFSTKELSSAEWYLFKEDKTFEIKLSNTINLGAISTISPGIQTGCDKVSKSHIENYGLKTLEKGEGIFVISDFEYKSLNFTDKEKQFIKPFYKNSQINKWTHETKNFDWIIITNRIDNINEYPNIKKHLLKYKVILDNRYRNFALINADKEGKWWYLYGYRPNTNFDSDKIVLPYRSMTNTFAYSDMSFYSSIDVFYINVTNNEYSTKYILVILCSKLIEYWLKNNCKKKGKMFELYQKPLSMIPIKKMKDKKIVENISDEILRLKQEGKSTLALEKQSNSIIYKLYELTYKEVKLIDQDFDLSEQEYEAIKL